MFVIYLHVEKKKEGYIWGAHTYVGEESEKAFTAAPGVCFTALGYMSRKEQVKHYADLTSLLNTDTNSTIEAADKIFEKDLATIYDTEVLSTLGFIAAFKTDLKHKLPTLLTPLGYYDIRGESTSFTGYGDTLKSILNEIKDCVPEYGRAIVFTNLPALCKVVVPETIVLNASAGKLKLGMHQAEVISRLTSVESRGLVYSYVGKPTTYPLYWKPSCERNPLLSHRYLVHYSQGKQPYYSTFDDKEIYDYGKRSNTVAYALVKPIKNDPAIDAIIDNALVSKLEPTTHYINLGNLYKPVLNSNLLKYGSDIFYTKRSESMYTEETSIGGMYDSPGLTQRGLSYHQNLEKVLERYLSGDYGSTLNLLDITDSFYEGEGKQRKVIPDLEKKGGLVKIPSPGAHKGFQFVVLGKDLPSRNALNKLTGDVKILLYSSKESNLVRYGCIVTANEGVGVYSYYNCNVRFVQLGT